ncbi:unnamed protein product [Amoebophrya sp. A25]|nr:unnamed protein product [Amoebophrya sp. A25]|eukprot:GSA25T00024542001.1
MSLGGSPSYGDSCRSNTTGRADATTDSMDSSVEGGPRFAQRVFHPAITRPSNVPTLDLQNLPPEEDDYGEDEDDVEEAEEGEEIQDGDYEEHGDTYSLEADGGHVQFGRDHGGYHGGYYHDEQEGYYNYDHNGEGEQGEMNGAEGYYYNANAEVGDDGQMRVEGQQVAIVDEDSATAQYASAS